MASADGSPWRLKAIIILMLVLTLLYGSYSVFGTIQTADEFNQQLINYSYDDNSTIDSTVNQTGTYEYNSDSGQDFISVLTGFGNFITFGEIENTWVRMIFNTFTSICLIVIGFLIYTFVRDWIPFI